VSIRREHQADTGETFVLDLWSFSSSKPAGMQSRYRRKLNRIHSQETEKRIDFLTGEFLIEAVGRCHTSLMGQKETRGIRVIRFSQDYTGCQL